MCEIVNKQTGENILKERKDQIKLYAESAASYRQTLSDLKKNAVLGLGMMEINGQVSPRQKIKRKYVRRRVYLFFKKSHFSTDRVFEGRFQ